MVLTDPAAATRLPSDMKELVQKEFPDARVRLDGSLETGTGDLYLPLLPASSGSLRKVALESMHPSTGEADLLCYSNGWCLLRVRKKGVIRSASIPAGLPDKVRRHVLSCKFPSDLIVPEHMVVSRSMKGMVGELNIPMVDEQTISKPDFGTAPPKDSLTAGGAGCIFVTSPPSGKIALLDDTTYKKVAEFPTEGTPSGMTCAEGKLFVADQAKGRILILDPKKKNFIGQIDLPPRSAPKGVAALPSGKWIYVSESATNTVAVIETATGRLLLRTKVPAGPARLAITPNGNTLIVLCVPAGQIALISTLNQRVIATLPVGAMPNAVVISKNSEKAFVSNRMSNTVSMIDLVGKKLIESIPVGASPTGLCLTADESKLFVANAKDNTISVLDLTKAKTENIHDIKLPLDVDFPGAIWLLRDGKHMLVSSESTDAIGILNAEKMEFESQPVIGHTSDEILWIPVN